MITRKFAIIIELIGITITSIGLGVELYYKADILNVIITGGSLVGLMGALTYAKIVKDG